MLMQCNWGELNKGIVNDYVGQVSEWNKGRDSIPQEKKQQKKTAHLLPPLGLT